MLNPEQPFAMVGAGSRKQRPYFGCLQQPQTQLAASAGREKCSLTVHAGAGTFVPAGDTGSVFEQLCMVVLHRHRCMVSATVPMVAQCSNQSFQLCLR
jgi:hypothetical protein